MTTYAAFLRGINVGGNTPVSMAELKACFENMGFSRVATYINSGNVIFCAEQTDARALEKQIEKALRAQFGYDIRVVVRSMREMERLLDRAPKGWEGDREHRLNIIILRHEIDQPAIIAELTPKAAVDELSYARGGVFWSTKLSALSRSGMTRIVGSRLYSHITVRGYNTVKKVYALMQQAEQG